MSVSDDKVRVPLLPHPGLARIAPAPPPLSLPLDARILSAWALCTHCARAPPHTYTCTCTCTYTYAH
jgi:hypothetical protein